MLTPAETTEAQKAYHRAHERKVEAVLEALCLTIRNITGVYPNERLREKLWEAIQFDV